MDPLRKILFSYFLTILLAFSLLGSINAQNIQIENDNLRLRFDSQSGALVSLQDIQTSEELISGGENTVSIWALELQNQTEIQELHSSSGSDFSYQIVNPSAIELKWENFKDSEQEDIVVTVEVRIDEVDPLSYWSISVQGIEESRIKNLVFPRVGGINDLGSEELAVPVWMGQLLKNPRDQMEDSESYKWSYPGGLSMQLLALYNPDRVGFYAASNDTLSYRKEFSFTLDDKKGLIYEVINLPDQGSVENGYSPAYEAVIGTFEGDWFSAAERYRDWGAKQSWSRDSRLKNGLSPAWLEETALWVWNREESDIVLSPAIDLRKELGLPVSVLWHWWHNESYDDSFPEYFPPREGKESFLSTINKAKDHDVNSIVYMNQLQWGTSTESFQQENAPKYAVKNAEGNMRSHVYNIFTEKSLTNMCIATDFWKDKYAGLAHKALDEYNVSGIYMDQACLSRTCYDSSHGHPLGGGNYWADNSAKLTNQIRSGAPQDNQPVLAGEGGLESYLPYLDIFLTLQVSRERYAGTGNWKTIPLFQAVYHEYGISFGSYSSLLAPPYDDKWPTEYAPENEQELLDEKYNQQFFMEQARSFVWGIQPTIANYQSFLAEERKAEIDFLKKLAKVRYEGLDYLLYGKFIRTPHIEFPSEKIDISRLSIYAGRKDDRVTTFEGVFPAIYSQAWKSPDNNMAIALASISDDPFNIDVAFQSDEYGLSGSGEIYQISENGRRLLSSYSNGNIEINFELDPKEICLIEIIPAGDK